MMRAWRKARSARYNRPCGVCCLVPIAELSHALFSFWSTKQGGQFVAAAFARRIVEALALRARF